MIITLYNRKLHLYGGINLKDMEDTTKSEENTSKSMHTENSFTEKLKSDIKSVNYVELITKSVPALIVMIAYAMYTFLSVGDIKSELTNISGRIDNIVLELIPTYIIQQQANAETQNVEKEDTVSFDVYPEFSFVEIENSNYIAKTVSVSIQNKAFLEKIEVEKNSVLASDFSGKEYSLSEIAGDPIILSYKENDLDVVFAGKFNQEGQWNGDCITNAYKSGELVYIMDARYENGNVTFYKEVFQDSDSSGTSVWYIANRWKQDGFNSGETWQYEIGENMFAFDFGSEKIKAEDVITVKMFQNKLSSKLLGYYNGNTSDGSYNDNTGQAYLVKFSESGNVRTLYQGNFKDGQFDDDTGNAWYIVKDEDTAYMYYKGFFKSGSPTRNDDSIFENDLTPERIPEIIGDKKFGVDLKWGS